MEVELGGRGRDVLVLVWMGKGNRNSDLIDSATIPVRGK